MKEHTIDTPIGFIYKTTCLVNSKIYIGKHEGKFGTNISEAVFYSSKRLKGMVGRTSHVKFSVTVTRFEN